MMHEDVIPLKPSRGPNKFKSPKRAEPRIIDPATHPRRRVCLAVAADYLCISERTVKARIESGVLPAYRDGRVYRIDIDDLCAYDKNRRATA
jgi:excisionase family DNA binding protein